MLWVPPSTSIQRFSLEGKLENSVRPESRPISLSSVPCATSTGSEVDSAQCPGLTLQISGPPWCWLTLDTSFATAVEWHWFSMTLSSRSNELTIHATELYVQYLHGQADEVQVRNDRLQVDLRDAENTYETVALSSEVAALLREGSRNFAALLRLDVPSLRGFENAELRAEFERLTQKLTNLN